MQLCRCCSSVYIYKQISIQDTSVHIYVWIFMFVFNSLCTEVCYCWINVECRKKLYRSNFRLTHFRLSPFIYTKLRPLPSQDDTFYSLQLILDPELPPPLRRSTSSLEADLLHSTDPSCRRKDYARQMSRRIHTYTCIHMNSLRSDLSMCTYIYLYTSVSALVRLGMCLCRILHVPHLYK